MSLFISPFLINSDHPHRQDDTKGIFLASAKYGFSRLQVNRSSNHWTVVFIAVLSFHVPRQRLRIFLTQIKNSVLGYQWFTLSLLLSFSLSWGLCGCRVYPSVNISQLYHIPEKNTKKERINLSSIFSARNFFPRLLPSQSRVHGASRSRGYRAHRSWWIHTCTRDGMMWTR